MRFFLLFYFFGVYRYENSFSISQRDHMYSIIAEQKPNTHIHMRIVFEYLQILYANKYFVPVQYLLLFARNEKQQTKVCRRQGLVTRSLI